ncbi:unnamed protein product [Trichobilharzia regenti]|nr:unnamed protein product [Trichobilharzia regenti]
MSQTTPQFVQDKRVTVSESCSDSTSLQGIISQSEAVKHLKISEEGHKLSISVIKKFENENVYHTNGGKLNICDNDHDSALLSLVGHVEMRRIPTTAELNKGSVHCQHEVDLKADSAASHVS